MEPQLDRKFFETTMTHVSPEERKALMKAFDLLSHRGDPSLMIAVGILRDAYMFRSMANAGIARAIGETEQNQRSIEELHGTIQTLEERVINLESAYVKMNKKVRE